MKTIKRLPRWTQVVAVLTAIYFAAFLIPSVWATLVWICKNIRSGNSTAIMIGVVQLFSAAAGIVIWLLSVYACSRGLLEIKKKAYAFLLAYFMICTVTAPLRYVSQKIVYRYWQRQIQEMADDQREQFTKHSVRKPAVAVANKSLALPVGQVLLLLAVLSMCKSDGIKITNQKGEYILNRADAV